MFLVVWQDMTKEVDEIVSEMEENMSNPMKTIQGFVDQISLK
jgi:predicted transcriptional regulator